MPDGGRADDGVGGDPDGAEDVSAAPPDAAAVRVVRAQRERHGADQQVSHRCSREIEREKIYVWSELVCDRRRYFCFG